MNLEEVGALRVLADRIGAVLGVSSALARSRAREMDLRHRSERDCDEIDRLRFELTADEGRARALAQRLAQPLEAKVYSPSAVMALEQARRIGSLGSPLTLLTPPGVDPIAWGAVAHLAGARAGHPLVLVHGTDAIEHDLDRWRDASASPLALAQHGTLLIVDVAALPRIVQDFLASSLAERVSPSGSAEPLDVWLAVSVHATVDVLVAGGHLSTTLADWLGDRALAIPGLAARSEDIRAMALDQLSRIGMRLRGKPLGVEDAVLARFMDHPWLGNDLEFADVLLRAALHAKGARVTVEELDAIGFAQSDPQHPMDSVSMPLPLPRHRRSRIG
jgi:transcriptional regulator of aromatic amino acid metabolism